MGNNDQPSDALGLSANQMHQYEALDQAQYAQQQEQQGVQAWDNIVYGDSQNTGAGIGQLGAQQASTTGGYRMSVDQARGLVAKMNKVLDKLKVHETKLKNIENTKPPGPDPVSLYHIKALQKWANTQLGYHYQLEAYIQHHRDAFSDSIKSYEENEARTSDDLHKHTRSLDA